MDTKWGAVRAKMGHPAPFNLTMKDIGNEQWQTESSEFYDNYSRKIKVFSGEYAAHPVSGVNMPHTNNLEGALAEAAFLTGIERNSAVVVLASYAPLFARVGYA